MFERRLKVFLLVLAIVTSVLIARAVQLQIVERDSWTTEAGKLLSHQTTTQTTRGRLLDVHGRVLAEDVPCFDACVDYRAIPRDPNPDWVREPVPDWKHDPGRIWIHKIAVDRVSARDGGHHDKSVSTRELINREMVQVTSDIDAMWIRLAQEGGMSNDAMNALRKTIVDDVETHRLSAWYRHDPPPATQTSAAGSGSSESWYRKWLPGALDDNPVDTLDDVRIDSQTEPHVILRSITPEVYNRLGKEQERYPGLVLRPGIKRNYPLPYALAACHVLGYMDRVTPDDVLDDPYKAEPLRAYTPNDLVGREGLERLCDPLLRGTRGQVDQTMNDPAGDSNPAAAQVVDPVAGEDVRTTIDVDLEQEIRAAFNHVNVKRSMTDPDIFADMHGAAVVIDVPTGEVRAMVSAPGFNPNEWDQKYAILNADTLNTPLRNRATLAMLETGSTIKPVVGIGAITAGKMGVNDTIECTGYLMLNGKKMSGGARCWTLSEFPYLDKKQNTHHQIPPEDPHPNGFLNFTDAIQRSCDIYFENMGERLGLDGLSYWMRTFGLGRITGVGISEAHGRLPDQVPQKVGAYRRREFSWLGGIGQGYVAATPVQMANVAATIARDGIWMRPRLVSDEVSRQLRSIAKAYPATQPSPLDWKDVPDQANLNLNPAAVAAAQEGMWRVVNTIAGTGTDPIFNPNLEISGKTGSAQAARLTVDVPDSSGKMVPHFLRPSTTTQPNKEAPWYLGTVESDGLKLTHAWFIGYAPSHHPKVAFAVLVEYGVSGGRVAGAIARQIIAACVQHGYLSLDSEARTLVK